MMIDNLDLSCPYLVMHSGSSADHAQTQTEIVQSTTLKHTPSYLKERDYSSVKEYV